ncbi:hypothetical protein D088_510028 [Salmonella enterica subsp. houtenae serovar 16:z4,z32:-- str. RKS3027]|nr:hypothetical protein D088_510028 [Salmonella enterica subsp. houtenae serovar 16:z4,z32:-- str. RKS3027]
MSLVTRRQNRSRYKYDQAITQWRLMPLSNRQKSLTMYREAFSFYCEQRH